MDNIFACNLAGLENRYSFRSNIVREMNAKVGPDLHGAAKTLGFMNLAPSTHQHVSHNSKAS